MAKPVEEITLGIDVSKQYLDVYSDDPSTARQIANNAEDIGRFLSTLNGPVVLAVEATNIFHEALVEVAQKRGCTVYLVDGQKISRYRDAVGVRAKTDALDAQLIHRYLTSERRHLRPLPPQNLEQVRLWRLLKRRAKVVSLRSQVNLSLRDIALDVPEVHEMLAGIDRLIKRLTRLAVERARSAGWAETQARLRTIPGVGELNALALQVLFNRGEFSRVDRFIAFLGLDVKVRDSGRFRGHRKLTKRGDPEVRRLLFNAARAAAYRQADWGQKKQQLMARGMSEIQSSVILARKIARIAYALLKKGGVYDAEKIACHSS